MDLYLEIWFLGFRPWLALYGKNKMISSFHSYQPYLRILLFNMCLLLSEHILTFAKQMNIKLYLFIIYLITHTNYL